MNKFIQHIPNYIGDPNPIIIYFYKFSEILENDIIKYWTKKSSFSYIVKDENSIMSVNSYGYEWYVIGYIDNIDKIDIPVWDKVSI